MLRTGALQFSLAQHDPGDSEICAILYHGRAYFVSKFAALSKSASASLKSFPSNRIFPRKKYADGKLGFC